MGILDLNLPCALCTLVTLREDYRGGLDEQKQVPADLELYLWVGCCHALVSSDWRIAVYAGFVDVADVGILTSMRGARVTELHG